MINDDCAEFGARVREKFQVCAVDPVPYGYVEVGGKSALEGRLREIHIGVVGRECNVGDIVA